MNVHSNSRQANPDSDMYDKRTAILRSTLFLVSTYGFHGTSMAMIAEDAGIGAGTIYRYFRNKDELIYQLIRDIQQRVIVAMLDGYDENKPYRERFEGMWLNMTRYYMSHPAEFQYAEQHRHSGYMQHLARVSSVQILNPVLRFFIEGKKKKLIKDLPLYTIIAISRGPIIEMAKLHIDHNQKLTEKRIQQACHACWDALRATQWDENIK